MSVIQFQRPPTMCHDPRAALLEQLDRVREMAQCLSEQVLNHAIEIERLEGMVAEKNGILQCCEQLIASIELDLGKS